MDKEQKHPKILGFLGILKESFKIILSNPKLFTKVTLAFILPLSCITIPNLLSSLNFLNNNPSPNNDLYLHSREAIKFWVFVILHDMYYPLAISIVVYTAACIYNEKKVDKELTGSGDIEYQDQSLSYVLHLFPSTPDQDPGLHKSTNEITFKKIMSIIPKVWIRLIITYISSTFISFVWFFIYGIVLFLYVDPSTLTELSTKQSGTRARTMVTTTVDITLFLLHNFTTTIFQIANIITTLEKYCGFKAIKKSWKLVKCNLIISIAISFTAFFTSSSIFPYSSRLIHRDGNIGVGSILFGILNLVSPFIMLYGLVVQTVFYSVFKS